MRSRLWWSGSCPVTHSRFLSACLPGVTTTATFKLQKNQLREEAYHPDRVDGDTIYVRKPRSDAYELLDADFYQQIVAGTSGY